VFLLAGLRAPVVVQLWTRVLSGQAVCWIPRETAIECSKLEYAAWSFAVQQTGAAGVGERLSMHDVPGGGNGRGRACVEERCASCGCGVYMLAWYAMRIVRRRSGRSGLLWR